MRKFYHWPVILYNSKGEVVVMENWKIMEVDRNKVKLLSKNRTKEKLLALEEEVPLCLTSPSQLKIITTS